LRGLPPERLAPLDLLAPPELLDEEKLRDEVPDELKLEEEREGLYELLVPEVE